jgi:hypothetical protein
MPVKMPKTFGACADLLYETREKRLAVSKQVEALEKEESEIRAYLIDNLPNADTGAAGKLARVERYTKVVPKAEDWEKVYGWVKKTGRFDLLQRRLNDKAVAEMWENKKTVPGVEPFTVVAISLKKV